MAAQQRPLLVGTLFAPLFEALLSAFREVLFSTCRKALLAACAEPLLGPFGHSFDQRHPAVLEAHRGAVAA